MTKHDMIDAATGPFSEDLNMIRAQLRRFIETEVTTKAEPWEKDGMVPRDVLRRMGDLGVLGMRYDEQYGGAGLNVMSSVVLAEEVGRSTFGGFSATVLVHTDMASPHLENAGSPEQKARWMPLITSGEKIAAVAVTEPGAGSDVAGIRTRAVQDGSDWVINGTKMFITNGVHGDIYFVGAKTDPDAGSKGITAFLIEKSMKGFTTSPHFDKLGMRGSNTAELIFDDVEVPFENVLGEEGRGVRVLMSGLDYERVVLAGIGLGIMAACLDEIMPYMAERKQFGQPIGSFQLMQGKMADMYTAMNSARAYVYEVAKACDRGEVTRADAAACCLYASEEAMKQAHQAVQAMGGAGYLSDNPVGRIFRDAKLMEIGAGTSEIRRMLVGREMMGAMA